MQRRTLLKSIPAAIAATHAGWSTAADGPPLQILVPYAAGGLTDIMARALTDSLSTSLNRPVIVENRPGAAGLVATQVLQNRGGDGNTLMFINTGFVSVPLTVKAANYDPVNDFKPVSILCEGPSYLMINSGVPAKTLPEFIAWAKTQPNGITAANSGMGSSGHIQTMLFAKRTGLNLVHVSYKGSAETANALMTGQVQMQLTATTSALNAQVEAGKVRILAVAGAEPSALTPGVPTIASVLPGFVITGWYGLIAHQNITQAKIDQYASAIQKALLLPAVIKQYNNLFLDVTYKSPGVFAEEIRTSSAFWKQVVGELGLQRA